MKRKHGDESGVGGSSSDDLNAVTVQIDETADLTNAAEGGESAMNISGIGADVDNSVVEEGSGENMTHAIGSGANEAMNMNNPAQVQAVTILETLHKDHLPEKGFNKLVEDIRCDRREAESLEEYLENPLGVRPIPTWLYADHLVDDETILTYSIKKEAEHVVDLLLAYDLDVETLNRKGVTAISTAAHKGNTHIIKSLINAGSDVNRVNQSGSTALIQASHFGHADAVELLLKSGAQADFTNPKGTTALMRASQEGYSNISRSLILHGADVRRKNLEGMNALMLASQRGHHEMVLLLMLAGAVIDEQTSQGSTALMLACKRGNEKCVEQLIGLGAEIFILDQKARTALDTAVKKQFVPLIPWLDPCVQVAKMAESIREMRNKLIFKAADMSARGTLRLPTMHEYVATVLTYVQAQRRAFTCSVGDMKTGVIDLSSPQLTTALGMLQGLCPNNSDTSTAQLHAALVARVVGALKDRDVLQLVDAPQIDSQAALRTMTTYSPYPPPPFSSSHVYVKKEEGEGTAAAVADGESSMFPPVVYRAAPLSPLGIAPPASGGLHGSHSENLTDLFVSMDLNGTHISPPATTTRPSATRQQQKANGTAVKLSEPRRGYGDWAWPALMQRCLLLPESVLHCVVEFIPAPRVWNWSLHQLQRRHTLYVFCSIALPSSSCMR
jgi:ankyrin repeat protein